MSRLTELARSNGWTVAIARALVSAGRRFRDRRIAGKLKAPGFRAGGRTRLDGLVHMRIGRNFQAGNDLWLDAIAAYEGETFAPQLVVGDDVNLSDRVHIACIRSVSIGSGTLIGSGAIITDHAHGVYRGTAQTGPEIPPVKRALHSAGPVTIGRNCWLGDGVAVLAGASIGDGAIIGANSVVTGSIASGTIAAGAPARVLRNWNGQTGEWVQVATETNPSHREGHDGEPL